MNWLEIYILGVAVSLLLAPIVNRLAVKNKTIGVTTENFSYIFMWSFTSWFLVLVEFISVFIIYYRKIKDMKTPKWYTTFDNWFTGKNSKSLEKETK